MMFYLGGAISILALMIADFRRKKSADSLLLLLWICGTILFAIVVNWTVNARSLLPLIPAVAILIGRRLDEEEPVSARWPRLALAVPLIVCGAVSLWLAAADTEMANIERRAASYFQEKSRDDFSKPWMEGRWGFEYYMQAFGARPLEPEADQCKLGDLVIIPKYNTSLFNFPLTLTSPEFVEFPMNTRVTAMNHDVGAGFYFSGWGPLPFVFGPVPPQRYAMSRVMENR
jgi:hypothetical protein